MCFEWGMKHINTSQYYPCPILDERVNKNVKVALSIFHSEDQKNWDQYISELSLSFNLFTIDYSIGTTNKWFCSEKSARSPREYILVYGPARPLRCVGSSSAVGVSELMWSVTLETGGLLTADHPAWLMGRLGMNSGCVGDVPHKRLRYGTFWGEGCSRLSRSNTLEQRVRMVQWAARKWRVNQLLRASWRILRRRFFDAGSGVRGPGSGVRGGLFHASGLVRPRVKLQT
ncbi:hypothetical protein PR048_021005 [Dryococelus australis]|uniref:Uncharacterized protein n=1 Tax=Dryococelus australis TaxID=614101 RepID=A0ABQ9GX06_9NEOP|nr:hypothetical protein PR048_021005 [Dryococelus australis]